MIFNNPIRTQPSQTTQKVVKSPVKFSGLYQLVDQGQPVYTEQPDNTYELVRGLAGVIKYIILANESKYVIPESTRQHTAPYIATMVKNPFTDEPFLATGKDANSKKLPWRDIQALEVEELLNPALLESFKREQ